MDKRKKARTGGCYPPGAARESNQVWTQGSKKGAFRAKQDIGGAVAATLGAESCSRQTTTPVSSGQNVNGGVDRHSHLRNRHHPYGDGSGTLMDCLYTTLAYGSNTLTSPFVPGVAPPDQSEERL